MADTHYTHPAWYTRCISFFFHVHEIIKFSFPFSPLRLPLFLDLSLFFWKTGSTDSNNKGAAAEKQPLWPAFSYLRFIFRPQLTGLTASCSAFNIWLLLFAPSWRRPRTICIYFGVHWFIMTCGCQRAWLCSCVWLPFQLHEKRLLSVASSHRLGVKKMPLILWDWQIRTDLLTAFTFRF